jgi:hypothetical protein
MKSTNLQDILNQAARDLPYGWLIEINVEQGSGCINLYNPGGDKVDCEDMFSVDQNSDEQFQACIRFAVDKSKERL